MRIHRYLCAFLPLALGGCVAETPAPPVTTTTTVTREVTTTGPATTAEVIAPVAPPAIRTEVQTVAPGPNYVWTPGYWRWTGNNYVWVGGTWVSRPRPAATWVASHWVQRGTTWVWVPGHWQY